MLRGSHELVEFDARQPAHPHACLAGEVLHLPGESVLDPTGEHHLGHPSGGQGFEHRVSSVEQHVQESRAVLRIT